MSGESVDSMDKKTQACARQANLSVCKDVASSSYKNGGQDWKKGNNGKFQSNDGFKKYNQPKTTGFDSKRTRQKGNINNCKKDEVLELQSHNLSSDGYTVETLENDFQKKFKGSKSFHFMTSYHYEGRQKRTGNTSHISKHRANHSWSNKAFNKERFLQANCQFVVKVDGEYALQGIDPDALADWDQVLQVRLFVHEVPFCPICLFPPKAAKITRCGHVYCWPCILHYLSVAAECETSQAKCPICCENILEKDLRSVSATEVTKYEPGMQITMKLMKKIKGHVLAAPKLLWQAESGHLKSVRDEEYSRYAKLLIADDDYVNSLLSVEHAELLELLQDDKLDSLELSFIMSALHALENSREKFEENKKLFDPAVPVCESTKDKIKTFNDDDDDFGAVGSVARNMKTECYQAQSTNVATTKCYASAFDDEEVLVDDFCSHQNEDVMSDSIHGALISYENEPMENLQHLQLTSDSQNKQSPARTVSKEKNAQYFYQAADGQHMYLHNINVRCLKAEYLSLDLCPNEIVAKVVEVEEHTMDEENRKRMSYLSHLPTTCQFKIVELDLLPPLVSKESLNLVEDLIKLRRSGRQKREKRDRCNAAKIQEMENRRMGFDPNAKIVRSDYSKYRKFQKEDINFSGTQHFPEMNHFSNSLFSNFVTGLSESTAEDSNERSIDDVGSGLSFAQMLKNGVAKPVVVSSSKQTSERSASGSKLIAKKEDSDEEQSEIPEFKTSWDFDLTKQLEDIKLASKNEDNVKEKKKKSKQRILLFATGGVGPRSK